MSPFSTVTRDEEIGAGGTPTGVAEPPRRVESAAPPPPPKPLLAPRGKNWFNEALLEMSTTRPPKRTWDFVFAFAFEATVIIVLILIPLLYTEAIDLKQLTSTYLVAPPPPPPPPPPPAADIIKASSPRRVFTQSGRLLAPVAVPSTIAMLKEEALPPDIGAAGVEGGVPGGQVGGVLGGILQENVKTFQPIAPPTVGTRAKPLRVGGNVQPPVAIFSPPPPYPVLAKQAKIQGDVLINAVIDAEGNIVDMRVVSGHALLVHAALQTLDKWKYRPTVLNGVPVAVEFIATVRFRLS